MLERLALVREQVVVRREKEPPSLIARLDPRPHCVSRRQAMPRQRHGEDGGLGST